MASRRVDGGKHNNAIIQEKKGLFMAKYVTSPWLAEGGVNLEIGWPQRRRFPFSSKQLFYGLQGGLKSFSHYSSLSSEREREKLKGQTQTKLHDLIICNWGFKKIALKYHHFCPRAWLRIFSKQHIPNPIKVWPLRNNWLKGHSQDDATFSDNLNFEP